MTLGDIDGEVLVSPSNHVHLFTPFSRPATLPRPHDTLHRAPHRRARRLRWRSLFRINLRYDNNRWVTTSHGNSHVHWNSLDHSVGRTTQHNTTQERKSKSLFVRSFVRSFTVFTNQPPQRTSASTHTTADNTALPHAATVLTLYYAVLSFQCRRQPLLAVDRRSLTTERSNRRIVCSNCVTHCMLRSLLALRRCR